MASGFGGNRDAGAVLHSNGKILHITVGTVLTSKYLKPIHHLHVLNVYTLKDWRSLGLLRENHNISAKSCHAWNLNMEIHEGLTKTHPLGKAPLRGPSSDSSAFRFHTYFRMFITARAGLLHLLYPIVAFARHFEIQEEHVKLRVFFLLFFLLPQ